MYVLHFKRFIMYIEFYNTFRISSFSLAKKICFFYRILYFCTNILSQNFDSLMFEPTVYKAT